MPDAQPAGPPVSWRERHVPPRHAQVWVRIAGTWRPGLISYRVSDPGKPGWECAILADEPPGRSPWQGRYVYRAETIRPGTETFHRVSIRLSYARTCGRAQAHSPNVLLLLRRWAAWPRGIRWLVYGIAAVVLVLVVAWLLFVPVADWLAHHDVGSATGPLHETALDNARGRLLTLGAGLLAAGALVFTALNFTLLRRNSEQADLWQRRTHELTEQGQVTDRYTKAIEQLGSEKLDVRIGSIYALDRIARDSAEDHPAVMEVLTAFIREHSREPWQPLETDADPREPGADRPEKTLRPDVQAAISVVGRRDHTDDVRRLDLTGADLAGGDLANAQLQGAILTDATLTRAVLLNSDLTGALLFDADLSHALLNDINLSSTHLGDADLTDAILSDANLTDVTFANGPGIGNTVLTRAQFFRANLIHARLDHALLEGALLIDANLTGADLTNAKLADADLSGADLTGADLRGANLTGAKWPVDAPVPEGWELNAGTGRLRRAGADSGRAEAD